MAGTVTLDNPPVGFECLDDTPIIDDRLENNGGFQEGKQYYMLTLMEPDRDITEYSYALYVYELEKDFTVDMLACFPDVEAAKAFKTRYNHLNKLMPVLRNHEEVRKIAVAKSKKLPNVKGYALIDDMQRPVDSVFIN